MFPSQIHSPHRDISAMYETVAKQRYSWILVQSTVHPDAYPGKCRVTNDSATALETFNASFC